VRTLPTALLAYGTLAFAVAGTNQQSVQRYVSCATIQDGRKAILLGWFSGFVGVASTLLLGILLFGFYANSGDLPADIAADGILSHFIVNHVPIGASGLLVAAIFAAAMSSIDSALHSLATCMTVDFYQRYANTERSDTQSLKMAQILIVVWGIVGMASAFYVASTGQDLLPFLVTYTTMFLGPLLGLFLMGVLIPRVNATGAFYGTVAAVALLVLNAQAIRLTTTVEGVVTWPLNFPGIWQSAIIAPIAVLLGLLISLATAAPATRSINGLTLWSHNALD